MVNISKVGQTIFKAVEKSFPLGLDGISKIPPNLKFNISNPNLLEALPDHLITSDGIKFLSELNGKPLSKVAKFLDSVGGDFKTFSRAMGKYLKNNFQKIQKGFSEEEFTKLYNKAFPTKKVPISVNEDAFLYLNGLPKEIGSNFDAHGMDKISVTNQLRQLNNLLTNGIDKSRNFFTAPLTCDPRLGAGLGTAGGHAYRSGSFIVVADKGKNLVQDGIKHVIVNDAYYNIIDDLTAKFPDIKFVRADNAVDYFKQL